MLRFALILAILSLLSGCQFAAKRNFSLVQERVEKLKPLSHYPSTLCQVEARLTEPAQARYAQMYPEESMSLGTLSYTWRASEARCEVKPQQSSKVSENHRGFVEQGLCVLLQTHWVNSPFDELMITEDNLEGFDKTVRIRTGTSPDLGVFVDRKEFIVETKTKSRGVFKATYFEQDGWTLPQKIEHHVGANAFVVDQMSYQTGGASSRTGLKSLWISVGAEKPLPHTQLIFENCRRD